MALRIKQPAAALAGKTIVLTGKGVARVKGAGSEVFDRCPYEVLERQGILPSVIKPGSPDYVDVFAGRLAANEKQTISFDATPTAGSFTLTVLGKTTGVIAFNASASDVKAAIELAIGVNSVNVSGAIPAGFVVEFIGANAAKSIALIVVGSNTLSPSTNIPVAETVKGGASSLVPELDLTQIVLQISLIPNTTTPITQTTLDGNVLYTLKRVEFSRNAGT